MQQETLFAIPTERSETEHRPRSAHFGHSDQFTLIKVKDSQATITDTIDNIPHGAGGCLAPISLLRQYNIDGIIVGGMGKRPLAGFTEAGINVYWAPLETYPLVDDVIAALLADKLGKMSNLESCSGHNCHQHG